MRDEALLCRNVLIMGGRIVIQFLCPALSDYQGLYPDYAPWVLF